MQKVLIIVNKYTTVYKFRKELVERLVAENYSVTICCPNHEKLDYFRNLNVEIIDTKLEKRSINPFEGLRLIREYKQIMKMVKPSVVLTFTIKPNIYGGFAAKSLNIPYIANITGLGSAIENKGVLRFITTSLYKHAFKNIDIVFFQNQANLEFFRKRKIALGKHKLLPGSGVNLNEFKPLDYPENNNLIITYIGRIMKDKGIDELLEAIRIIKNNHKNIEFRIIGSYDDGLTYGDIINEYHNKGLINYLGYQDDIREFLKETNAVINPTYYEGMSNVLLEAAASARPILASNVPGSSEIFVDGVTGFGFEARNTNAIVETIEKFLKLSHKCQSQMGRLGRQRIEKEFNRINIIAHYIKAIQCINKDS